MRIPHSIFAAVCAFALATVVTACGPQETEFQETPAAEEEIRIQDETRPAEPAMPQQPGMQPTTPGTQPGTQQPGMQPGAPGTQPGTQPGTNNNQQTY